MRPMAGRLPSTKRRPLKLHDGQSYERRICGSAGQDSHPGITHITRHGGVHGESTSGTITGDTITTISTITSGTTGAGNTTEVRGAIVTTMSSSVLQHLLSQTENERVLLRRRTRGLI
jgi:hypothetical protein